MGELPDAVVDDAERLTRLARQVSSDAEAAAYRERRDEQLAEYDYAARVREDGSDATLVCYPRDWLVDGTVVPDRIDDLDRGIERPLSGPGDPDQWTTIETYNQQIAAAVAETYGPDHGANAKALAAFASDHYAKPIDALTEAELAEFQTEYYVRNVWPTADQRDCLSESLTHTLEIAADHHRPDR